jgi:Leucine-rich repeat (LRR) protein
LFAVFQSRREELIKQGYEKVRERELPVITKLEKLGGRIVYDENKIAKELMLDDSGVTDDDLQEIETLSDLTNVRLSNTKITNATVRRLGNLSKLEQIDLSNTQITDDAIASLTTLQYLFSLDLSKTSITGSELPSLKSLQRLFSLSLDHTMINDRGLEYLEPLKTLRVLSLSNTQVSDRGLELLGSRTELIGLFSDADRATKKQLMTTLSAIDITNINKYKAYFE